MLTGEAGGGVRRFTASGEAGDIASSASWEGRMVGLDHRARILGLVISFGAGIQGTREQPHLPDNPAEYKCAQACFRGGGSQGR